MIFAKTLQSTIEQNMANGRDMASRMDARIGFETTYLSDDPRLDSLQEAYGRWRVAIEERTRRMAVIASELRRIDSQLLDAEVTTAESLLLNRGRLETERASLPGQVAEAVRRRHPIETDLLERFVIVAHEELARLHAGDLPLSDQAAAAGRGKPVAIPDDQLQYRKQRLLSDLPIAIEAARRELEGRRAPSEPGRPELVAA
jgi:hypothetical protein